MDDTPSVGAVSLPLTAPRRVRVYTAPAAEPVAASDIITHLRLPADTSTTYLDTLIKAAREYAEEYQGRKLITQTLDLTLDEFPDEDYIVLPYPRLQSVTSVKYTVEAGTESTFAAANYHTDIVSEPGRVFLKVDKDWPSDSLIAVGGVVVRYITGYGTAGTSVPASTILAIKMLVGLWWENRESHIEIQGGSLQAIPFGVRSLLDRDRVEWVG